MQQGGIQLQRLESKIQKGHLHPNEAEVRRHRAVSRRIRRNRLFHTDRHHTRTRRLQSIERRGFLEQKLPGQVVPNLLRYGNMGDGSLQNRIGAEPASPVSKPHLPEANVTSKTHSRPANRNIIETHSHYTGKYIEETETDGLHLIDRCAVEGTATFVQCPPLICGIRLKIHNPYRPQEIETSNEIIEEAHSRNVHEEILGDARIVGGEGSQPAAWPWVVSVYKNGVFHCSGVVVSELWIVSAAHCVDKQVATEPLHLFLQRTLCRYWIHYYEINAGALRRFSYAPQTQRRWVTHAIPHPHYNKSTLQHDISLLKLSSPLRYNRYVRPICLPTEATAGGDFFNVPYPGTKCTVVGWGATTEHSPDRSSGFLPP